MHVEQLHNNTNVESFELNANLIKIHWIWRRVEIVLYLYLVSDCTCNVYTALVSISCNNYFDFWKNFPICHYFKLMYDHIWFYL